MLVRQVAYEGEQFYSLLCRCPLNVFFMHPMRGVKGRYYRRLRASMTCSIGGTMRTDRCQLHSVTERNNAGPRGSYRTAYHRAFSSWRAQVQRIMPRGKQGSA